MRTSAARCATALVVASVTTAAHLVLTAAPAAAHAVEGGALPAPPWLLSYIGAFAVALTALGLRAAWTTPRWAVTAPATPDTDDDAPRGWARLGGAITLALFVGVLAIAIAGPDVGAANITPTAVFVIWWVGLPTLCLFLGDVLRGGTPFSTVVTMVERATGRTPGPSTAGPTWVAAAFLAAFGWFLVAYHRPGSPRAIAVFLGIYAIAAVAGGLRWGSRWLATGEGFGALSRAVSQISPRRRQPAPPGTLALVVVWLGGTGFDGFSSTSFWQDVLGTSQGWSRTLLNTVGLVWCTAIIGAVVLLVLRLALAPTAADDEHERDARAVRTQRLSGALGLALVPLALAWFLAHDITFFLLESQNFYALLSDPLGRGWDLFGTLHHTIDYSIVRERWVRWVQLGTLLAGHVVAVVLAHDAALRVLDRRSAMRVTWVVTAALAASAVAAALLVLQ